MNVVEAMRDAAATLAERLRGGALPRASRSAARRVLVRAFDACENGRADVALLREVDALAHPWTPRIPAPPRIGIRFMRGAVDPALVDRICARERRAERISARIDRFVEATGGTPLRLFVRVPVDGAERPGCFDPLDVELPLG